MAAHECYIAILEMDDHLQALNIDKRKVIVELIDDLKEIPWDNDTTGWTTRIGTQADPLICKELSLFQKNDQDVFTWSHKDMPGISPSTMVHKLNVYLSFFLI